MLATFHEELFARCQSSDTASACLSSLRFNSHTGLDDLMEACNRKLIVHVAVFVQGQQPSMVNVPDQRATPAATTAHMTVKALMITSALSEVAGLLSDNQN